MKTQRLSAGVLPPLALTLTLVLTACGTAAAAPESTPLPAVSAAGPDATLPPETAKTLAEGHKILVAYFTRAENITVDPAVDAVASAGINLDGKTVTGNVQYLADMIADAAGGDLFSIRTQESYPTGYRETTDLARTEQNQNARPALAAHVEDFDQYDVIFLGYPNWWGAIPQAVCSFLEEYDFSGKTIIPFASHEGSNLCFWIFPDL